MNIYYKTYQHVGRRQYMEDQLFVINSDTYMSFVVLDGHASADTAIYLETYLKEYIPNYISSLKPQTYQKWFRNMFKDCETALANGGILGGSTMSIVILYLGYFYSAYVGDSQIAELKNNELTMSSAHNTSNNEDTYRVILSDRRCYVDPAMYINGSINLTRTMGDFHVKRICSGITSDPEMNCYLIKQSMRIVIASDGLWNSKASWNYDYIDLLFRLEDDKLESTFRKLSDVSVDNLSVIMITIEL